jgi:hypothetical protein
MASGRRLQPDDPAPVAAGGVGEILEPAPGPPQRVPPAHLVVVPAVCRGDPAAGRGGPDCSGEVAVARAEARAAAPGAGGTAEVGHSIGEAAAHDASSGVGLGLRQPTSRPTGCSLAA